MTDPILTMATLAGCLLDQTIRLDYCHLLVGSISSPLCDGFSVPFRLGRPEDGCCPRALRREDESPSRLGVQSQSHRPRGVDPLAVRVAMPQEFGVGQRPEVQGWKPETRRDPSVSRSRVDSGRRAVPPELEIGNHARPGGSIPLHESILKLPSEV
jgi:hypothetical protein